MRPRLGLDIAASVLGRVASAGAVFVFTPLYLRLLGPESFGLLGLYAVLLATSLCLDQALSPMVAQRFARAAAGTDLRAALRALEPVVLLLAVAIGALVLVLSPWLARDAVHARQIDQGHLAAAFRLMAVLLVLQWPSSFYAAALAGLGRQIPMNLLRSGLTLAQWLGGAALLALTDGSILALLLWNGLCFAALSGCLRWLALRSLPDTGGSTRRDWSVLRDGWRFSSGTLLIGITGTVLTQADKLFVATLHPLGGFAAYSLAFTVASIVSVFIAQPIMSVALPHFSRLAATADARTLALDYHRWTQLAVCTVVPVVGTMIFHAPAVLAVWLRSPHPELSAAGQYVPWIAAGTLLNVLMMLPLTLQLAHGWSALSAWKNLLAMPVFLAVNWWGIAAWGPVAGACSWFALNLAYYLLEVPLMHRRLLQSQLWRWWLVDTAAPCALGLAVFWAADQLLLQSGVAALARCLAATLVSAGVLWAAVPAARQLAASLWTSRAGRT